MKVIHGACSEENEPSDYKTCPVCGAVCFSDMEICFGCLHPFSQDAAGEASTTPFVRTINTHQASNAAMPEIQSSISQGNKSIAEEEDGLIAHHVCSDKNGKQFEIAISVKML